MAKDTTKKKQKKSTTVIGRNIRELREDAGLSANELGRRSGTLHLNKVESGAIHNPGIGTLILIAGALRVGLDAVLTGAWYEPRLVSKRARLLKEHEMRKAKAKSDAEKHEKAEAKRRAELKAHSIKTGADMRKIRIAAGLTARGTAVRLGVGRSTYHRMETGERPWTPGEVAALIAISTSCKVRVGR